nr:HAD-IIIA family hydrolase [uncultured Campylobacter sp.]
MIKIIFLDVDGCLSDGGLYHSNGGEEMKKFNVKDGFGIQEWQRLGLKVAIITGKSSQIVANRARELKIDTLFQGEKDKLSRAEQILKNFNLSFDEAAAIGDDINDAKLLNAVAISFKPADALSSLKADVALSKNGGCGAVREMIEMLIDKNGMREEWNSKWL